jgi:hypothetical protein
VGAGSVTGAISLSQAQDLSTVCGPTKTSCPPSEQGRIDDAVLLGHVSTASFAAGGAALGVGIILLAVESSSDGEPDAPAKKKTLRIEPAPTGLRIRF